MEEPVPAWVPNERFRSEAAKFAEYRTTERYRADEIEYKAGLGALLRHLTAADVLASEGAAGLEALASGHPDLDAADLSDDDRASLAKWASFQSLLNLLGGGQAAVIQVGTFRRWAGSESDAVAMAVEGLLRGTASLPTRVDAFLSTAQEAYGRLFAQGALRAKEVPRVSPQFAAILLGLTDPNTYGLFRPAVYQASADSFGYPLSHAGTTGQRYAATTAMLIAFREALHEAGCAVGDLLEVHNLLWIRAREPSWSGMGVDRWAAGDFDAMRTEPAQDAAAIGIIESKLRRVGDGLRIELRTRTGRDFRSAILGRYPPSRRSWPWLNVSMGELRYGSQPTARPQLNVEMGPSGIDVFYAVNLGATAGAAAAVRARVRERRGDPALLEAALEAGYTETQGDDGGFYMVRRQIPQDTVMAWPGLGIDELASELDLLLPIYEAMAAPASPPPGAWTQPNEGVVVDPLFVELEEALDDRGQAILYGPPGTGKTWNAHRFALWWLTKSWGGDADAVLADPAHTIAADARLTRAQRERRAWWVVAESAEWSWDRLFADRSVDYRYGRVKPNYDLLQEGDLVIGYQANPDKRMMALAKVARTLHETPDGPKITLEPVAKVPHGIANEEHARAIPSLP